MQSLDVFTVRDLRERTGDLLRDAESGRLALVTKHGRPAFLAVPFDAWLVQYGMHRALALHLFQAGHASLTTAAKIAGIATEEFVELLAAAGVDAVDYPAEEIDEELGAAL